MEGQKEDKEEESESEITRIMLNIKKHLKIEKYLKII